MKRSSGDFFVQQEASVVTGVSVEKSLGEFLSSEQIDRVIHGESIPLNKTTKLIGWDISHTHLMYEDTTKQEVVLVGSVIRSVDKTIVTPRLVFNWFFVAAMLHLVLLWMAYLQRRVYAAFLASAAACAASVSAASTILASPSVAAILATSGGNLFINSKGVRQATIVGSLAMIIAIIAMWFI